MGLVLELVFFGAAGVNSGTVSSSVHAESARSCWSASVSTAKQTNIRISVYYRHGSSFIKSSAERTVVQTGLGLVFIKYVFRLCMDNESFGYQATRFLV